MGRTWRTKSNGDTHHELADKRKLAEARRRALETDREVAAQHLTVEISMATTDMQDLNAKIKDLQRKIYFIAIERNRKRKVAKKLKDELKLEEKGRVGAGAVCEGQGGRHSEGTEDPQHHAEQHLEANLGVESSSQRERGKPDPGLYSPVPAGVSGRSQGQPRQDARAVRREPAGVRG